MLWDCEHCGCKAIAASLTICPVCREEKGVPKATVAGPSNRWGESEVEATPEQVAGAPETSYPDQASAKAKEAKTAFEAGNHDEALRLLDEAAVLHPERADDFARLQEKVLEAADVAGNTEEEAAPVVEEGAKDDAPTAEDEEGA